MLQCISIFIFIKCKTQGTSADCDFSEESSPEEIVPLPGELFALFSPELFSLHPYLLIQYNLLSVQGERNRDDTNWMDVLYISNIPGNIEIFHFPEILEEDNVPSYGSGSGSGSTYARTRDSKRESITTVISPEYEREILQVAKIHHNIYPICIYSTFDFVGEILE